MERDSDGLLAASENTELLYEYLRQSGHPNFAAHVDLQGHGFSQVQGSVERLQTEVVAKPETQEKLEVAEQLRARSLIQYGQAFADIVQVASDEGYFAGKFFDSRNYDRAVEPEQERIREQWKEIAGREDYKKVQKEADEVRNELNQVGDLVFRDALTQIETRSPS